MKSKYMKIGAAAVLAVAVLGFVGKCMDDSDHGRGGKYSGESFAKAFLVDEDEGVIYKLSGTPAVKVLFPVAEMEGGYAVEYDVPGNEVVVFVETDGKSYKAGDRLGDGYYIRRGEIELAVTALDDSVSNKTFARYVEVTHKGTLEKIAKANQEAGRK